MDVKWLYLLLLLKALAGRFSYISITDDYRPNEIAPATGVFNSGLRLLRSSFNLVQ